jgi:two-component system sensor histidine kinase CpxA
MARAEGDPTARHRQPVDLNELLAEVQAACTRDPDARDVRIATSGTVTRPVTGDRELLRRAIENVVRNAVRYTPAGGAVDVQITETAADVTVAVRDYGPGVPAGELARIFDPFYRVDESRDASAGGIGLGLAIARRAIQVHQGVIAADNANPGLRVTIALPS